MIELCDIIFSGSCDNCDSMFYMITCLRRRVDTNIN